VPAPSSAARLRGLLLNGLAAVSWGTSGSVTTVLVQRAQASPLVIGAVRMVLAGALLAALARLVAGTVRVAPADRLRCVGMGLAMAVFQAAYFFAVTMTGIAVAALLAICSAPLVITLLAVLFLGERPGPRAAGALALGVTGTALLVAGPGAAPEASPRFLGGAALALTAGGAYAVYVVMAKAALARTPPLPLAGANFLVAALALAPALTLPGAGSQIALGWAWMLYLGVVATAGAYALYTIGLRDVSASTAGIASLLEPLTATVLGVAIFGERLGAAGLAGAVLLLAALGLVATREA
jgi:DME family drug/metabolite transporter